MFCQMRDCKAGDRVTRNTWSGWSVVVGGGKGRGIEMVNRKGEMVARQSPSRKAKPGEALISLDLTWTTIRVDLSS